MMYSQAKSTAARRISEQELYRKHHALTAKAVCPFIHHRFYSGFRQTGRLKAPFGFQTTCFKGGKDFPRTNPRFRRGGFLLLHPSKDGFVFQARFGQCRIEIIGSSVAERDNGNGFETLLRQAEFFIQSLHIDTFKRHGIYACRRSRKQ